MTTLKSDEKTTIWTSLECKEFGEVHIKDFQDMMGRIYFHRDSKRGVTGTYDWLVEEVGELGEAIKKDDGKVLRDEFADVLAWLASLANVANVDLESAALGKYNSKCPKCSRSPCNCSEK